MQNDASLLAALQQITNWGVLTTDNDLTVTTVNDWFEANSGRKAAEIVGKHLLEVFPEVAARKLDDRYRQVLNGNTAILSQRLHGYLFSMPSGIPGESETHMQQSVRIAPLLNDGQVVGTLTVVEDVTERVQFESELRQKPLRSIQDHRRFGSVQSARRRRLGWSFRSRVLTAIAARSKCLTAEYSNFG